MSSDTTMARCQEVKKKALKRRKSAGIGLKILSAVLPAFSLIPLGLYIQGRIVQGLYDHNVNLTREIFIAQGQALWHEGVVGLPLFLLFLFLAVIFSILALYFFYLFRMPEFGTLYITGRSSVAETDQHEGPSTLSQRVQDFFSGPYSG